MKQLVIKTKAWTRGEYCNSHGHCCAIGFLAKQQLKKEGKTRCRSSVVEDVASCLNLKGLHSEITEANDELRGEERKKKLRELFRRAGYRLIFK